MKILLFGITRDIVGKHSLELPGPEADSLATADQLKAHLMERYPDLRKVSSLALAVNNEYATANAPVREGDEIALIPPVSGG